MAEHKYPLMTIFGRTLSFISQELEEQLKKHNIAITIGEFVLLYRLSTMESDKITQQNFANKLGKHKSVVLRQIDVLEKKNFVARLSDPTDKRKNNISLTKNGLKIMNQVMAIENELMDKLTTGIPEADLETLKHTAWKIQENALALHDTFK